MENKSTNTQIHECEVRELIRWRIQDKSWNRVTEFMNKPNVAKRAEKLKKDVNEQFLKGNKGNKGEWYN